MLDPRIYRAAFLPLVAAVVLMMFSLEPAPEPLEGPVSTPAFQGSETTRKARAIAALAPDRKPGSEGDAAVADLVREEFAAVPGGELSEQSFSSSFEGSDVELQNILLTLPGRREEVVLVLADRDSPIGQGATTSAASTATLLTLAGDLGEARHERTLVFASTSGASLGSEGARELVDQLPAPAGIEAAIVIENAGVKDRRPPFIVPGRSGPDTIPVQLLRTADAIASVQFERDATPADGWGQLARLAYPIGIGAASGMDAAGTDALAITGSGERPPDPDADSAAEVSRNTVFAVGSTALDLTLTLDENAGGVEAGPGSYIEIGDNLLPGWTISLLTLAMLLPALLGAGDVWLRERRRKPQAAGRAVPWALERALLPIAALVVAYALGAIGLIANPDFPYDPGRFPPGIDGPVAIGVMLLAAALVALLIRPLRTPLDAEPHTLAAAAGLLTGFSILGIWLINPFLALLLTPLAHVWLLPARAQGPAGAGFTVTAIVVASLPALAAGIVVASDLDLGLEAAWQLLLLLMSGQISPLEALLWCGLIGGLISCLAARSAAPPLQPPSERRSVLGPAGHAGPGSLGGTPSSLPRPRI